MNNPDELIADMGALMSGDNDPQNDLPLFQPSEVTDPEERIKVIDVELKKLGEEKRSALDDDALLMNIIRQIKRLTEEKSVSLFIVGEILTITNEVDDYNNYNFPSLPLPLLHIGTHQKAEHHPPFSHRRMFEHPQGCG